jgi:glutathione S-transferase
MAEPIPNEYVIHGIPRSLFTRKLQAAFAFYGLPHRVEPRAIGGDDPLGQRAGTHQIPILVTPENWALADTTPILQLLDARVPARRLFPEGPLGVLVHVVEEILDEWVARVMVHYRWHYVENTIHVIEELLGKRLGEEEARAHPMAQWGPRACRATGTENPAQRKAAEAEYLGILGALEAQLAKTPFALGGRPTAVDTILLGGLHAHTNADPIPDLAAFPKVVAWAEGGAAAAAPSPGDALAPFPESTPFACHLLRVGAEQYAAFVLANAEALGAGRKVLDIETYGEPTTYLARPYPEQSRRLVQARIRDQLGEEERRMVSEWLDEVGLSCFLP